MLNLLILSLFTKVRLDRDLFTGSSKTSSSFYGACQTSKFSKFDNLSKLIRSLYTLTLTP